MSILDANVVTIGLLGASHVRLDMTAWDPKEHWIRGNMEVASGPWRGTCGVWFHMGELRKLAADIERLHRDLVGPIDFRPMEPYLELQMTGDGKGQIVVEGKAGDLISDGNYVAFRFGVDQTQLPAIARALRTADPA